MINCKVADEKPREDALDAWVGKGMMSDGPDHYAVLAKI